ncbi:MAG: putative heme-binding domain-containing protein [Pirellulaceae bacterium]|jgi:putative heme-binding domain-containing protein
MRAYASLLLLLTLTAVASAELPKKYSSPVVNKDTAGHRIDNIAVDITGAKQLILEVSNGGDDTSYDWANWIEPVLVGPDGEKKLTELKWSSVNGRASVDKTAENGGKLSVGGKPVAFGIGTHAESTISYKLPKGFTTFKCSVGIDDGGTGQAGSRTTVQFHIYTSTKDRPLTQKPFTVADGFDAEEIYTAGVPEIGSWVVMCVDGKGRLIVSDRTGPMYRITLAEAAAAEQTPAVEKLPVQVGHANGLLEAFGSLYVVGKSFGDLPKNSGLFRLTDTTKDDHYDKVEHLMTLSVGSDHHAHNVLVSPSGDRLTILCGNSTDYPDELAGKSIRNQLEDHLLPRSTYYGHNTGRTAPGGFVVTCTPDGKDRRIHAAGFRNPYDFAYNQNGDLFTFDADMEYDVGGPWYRPTRVNHTVSGAEFGWRWGAGKWPVYYPDSVGIVADIGRGSPTGVTFGYGAKFPGKYQRSLFIADWTYGRIMALHMKQKGATYTGVVEPFIAGKPMPVADLVIHPDGNMYFITGGRRNTTSLIRLRYVGSEPTEPVELKYVDTPAQMLRRKLESYHDNNDEGGIELALANIGSDDRQIRYAARTVLEHRDVSTWIDASLKRNEPAAAIEAAIAIARFGVKDQAGRVIERLLKTDPKNLAREQQIDLMRAYGLVFIRLDKPTDATRQAISDHFSPLYPSGDLNLDRELCQLLLYVDAPGAVTKSVTQLALAATQANQMFYAYHLRTIREGWSEGDRRRYFRWLQTAQSNQGDYVGGQHFGNFLTMVRKESSATLTAEEKTKLADVLKAGVPVEPVVPKPPAIFVKAWKYSELERSLAHTETNRSFIQGRNLYQGLCAKCHLFKGKGGAIGPDITSVGNKMKTSALLSELLTPSKVISDQHASVILELKNGKTVTGKEVGGDDDVVRVVTNPGDITNVTEVKKSDILSRVNSKTSIMPTGLVDTLNEEQILDLMMYVLSGGNPGHIAFQQ